jgi:hypothetical protein
MPNTLVRNHRPGPTVFGDESVGAKPVVWQGAGDPGGLDVRSVPQPIIDAAAFQDALEVGIFSLVDSDAEAKSIRAQRRENVAAAIEAKDQASTDVIDQPKEDDWLVLSCLGPAGRGSTELCNASVTLKATEVETEVPLCPKHGYLKSQFVRTETGRLVGNNPERVWTRQKPSVKEG